PLPSSFKTSYRPSLVSLGPATPLSAIDRRVCPLSPGTEIPTRARTTRMGGCRILDPPPAEGQWKRLSDSLEGRSARRPTAARTSHPLEPGGEKPAEEHARKGQQPEGDRESESDRETRKIRHESARPRRT